MDHLNETHPQYAHPKKTHSHPLPPDILNSFTLTSLEQCEASIPKVLWLVPLFDSDKENHTGPSSHKRKSNNTANRNAKKAWANVQFLSFHAFIYYALHDSRITFSYIGMIHCLIYLFTCYITHNASTMTCAWWNFHALLIALMGMLPSCEVTIMVVVVGHWTTSVSVWNLWVACLL
jgi:hypothetical protein